MKRWGIRAAYVALLVSPVPLLFHYLSASKFPGGFIYPPHFRRYNSLFHYQEALFVALIIAAIGLITARLPNRWLRFAIYAPLFLWAVWLTIWAFVRSAFMIQLSPWYALDLLIHPSAIAGVGVNPAVFYPETVGFFALVFALAAAGSWLSRKITIRFATWTAVLYFAIFLCAHIPARAYIVHHVNRGQQAVMEMDDWTPLPLRTEFLLPGLRARRLTLPNLENPQRTQAYVDWIKHFPTSQIPRKIDILWIVVESFRADAISEKTTPYLWNHASDFQLKLDRNHWSGGNASQFGLFSMFTGMSGYQLQTFIRGGAYVPFFKLLEQNGYRVRIANRQYFDEAGKFRSFLPPTLFGPSFDAASDEADRQMTDSLLEDMKSRPAAPALDVVTFDSTHWPFYYPQQHDVFEPAAAKLRGVHVTRTRAQAEEAHNRFRNASHFIDGEIGRLLESLRARGALDHTVVIVAGDHGEEFMERGQVFHGGAMDDFQGRPVLWMHFPDASVASISGDNFTSHVDLVPTLLDCLGFKEDILRMQGQSLLHPRSTRSGLLVSEHGYYFPYYNALVTKNYISRWRNASGSFSFSGVTRRDGGKVVGDEWLNEAKEAYPAAANEYEILPDPATAPPAFR